MKFETIDVSGFEGAIRGMRNPLESWAKSDTTFEHDNDYYNNQIVRIGENDLDLMQRLIKGGPEHRKFLRYIHVQFDMTAPLYVWKEFDTYKIGTVANSTSTMHKLASTPITLDCFETDSYDSNLKVFDREPYNYNMYMSDCVENIIDICETLRKRHLEYKGLAKNTLNVEDKELYTDMATLYWRELVRWLPESWLQTRTIDLNYEVLRTIVKQRKNHKLIEWHQFIDWVHALPYADELIFFDID